MIKIKTIKFNFIIFSLFLTPIIYATFDSIKLLLNATRNENITEVNNIIENENSKKADEFRMIALTEASRQGHYSIVLYLLKTYGINSSVQNSYNPTLLKESTNIALILASMNGHLDIVRYLLKRGGINLNVQNIHGHTPLMLASMNGHYKVVKHLLSLQDIDPNLQDSFGNTALMWAIKKRHKILQT